MATNFKGNHRTFWATVFKANGVNYPEGRNMPISCNQVFQEEYALNSIGVDILLQTVETTSGNYLEVVSDAAGTIFPPELPPVPYSAVPADNNRMVVKIKDMQTLIEYYVDKDSYYANVVNCNPLAQTQSICDSIAGLVVSSPGSTSAVFDWNSSPSAAGYEWVNNQTSGDPVGNGAFVATNSLHILSGLTPSTTYYFHVRTVCSPSGTYGPWATIQWQTAA